MNGTIVCQDPGGQLARRAVQAFLDEVCATLTAPDSKDLQVLGNPLSATLGTPAISLAHKSFLGESQCNCLRQNWAKFPYFTPELATNIKICK
jgi:hypothetical protein